MKRTIWLAIFLLSLIAAEVVILGGIGSAVRPFITLWFMLVIPGMIYVQLFDIGNVLIELSLAVVLSIVINTLTAETMLYSGTWSAERGFLAVVVICMAGLLFHGWLDYDGLRDGGEERMNPWPSS